MFVTFFSAPDTEERKMNDKKVTQSITMIGGFLTLISQSLLGFEVIPAGGEDAASGIVENLVELARNVFALVTLYGVRRKMGES